MARETVPEPALRSLFGWRRWRRETADGVPQPVISPICESRLTDAAEFCVELDVVEGEGGVLSAES